MEVFCHDDILLLGDTAALCHWLCAFCKEARREDGKVYTPRSITQLQSGIQQYIREKVQIFGPCIDFLTPYSTSYMPKLLKQPIVSLQQSQDDKVKLWSLGVVGVENPESSTMQCSYTMGYS